MLLRFEWLFWFFASFSLIVILFGFTSHSFILGIIGLSGSIITLNLAIFLPDDVPKRGTNS